MHVGGHRIRALVLDNTTRNVTPAKVNFRLSPCYSLMQDWHRGPSPPPLLGPNLMSVTATTALPQSTDNVENNTNIEHVEYEVPETRMHCEFLNCDQPVPQMMECLAYSAEIEDEEDGNEDLDSEKRCESTNCEQPTDSGNMEGEENQACRAVSTNKTSLPLLDCADICAV